MKSIISAFNHSAFICLFFVLNSTAQRKIDITTSGASPNYQPVSIIGIPDCNFMNTGLTLTFNDEFNTNSLDNSKWNPSYPWGMANNDSSDAWCDPNEILFSGSSIKLGCNKKSNNVLLNGNSIIRDYGVGVISSKQKFNYGYYEIRCKIPRIAELWPAFWLFGDCDQELDIFEFIGSNNISSKPKAFHDPLWACSPHKPKWYIPQECASANPIMTFHTPRNTKTPCLNYVGERRDVGRTLHYSAWRVKTTYPDFKKGCIYDDVEVDVDFHNDWHTFAISFQPDAITWYIDGEVQFTEYKYFIKNQTPTFYSQAAYIPVCLSDYCFNGMNEPIYEQVNYPRGDIDMEIIINNNHKSLPDYNLIQWVDNITNWPDGYLEVDYFRYYKFTESDKKEASCRTSHLNFNSFEIYPNPSSGQMVVSTNSNLLLKNIKVINNFGEVIHNEAFNSKECNLALNISPGIYYVQFSCNGNYSCKKIVIID